MDFSKTEQNNSLISPPIQKPYSKTADLIDLVVEEKWENIFNIPLARGVKNRVSHRNYSGDSLSLEELSFLLWATPGFRLVEGNNTIVMYHLLVVDIQWKLILLFLMLINFNVVFTGLYLYHIS